MKALFSVLTIVLVSGVTMVQRASAIETSGTNGICNCVDLGFKAGDTNLIGNCARGVASQMAEASRQNQMMAQQQAAHLSGGPAPASMVNGSQGAQQMLPQGGMPQQQFMPPQQMMPPGGMPLQR